MSGLAAKLALKKIGLPSDTFGFGGASNDSKPRGTETEPTPGSASETNNAWPTWMQIKNLPLTVQPWLAPPPPAVQVGELPKVGGVAPVDRDRQLTCGGGKRVLVVFLRCVGCAFAKQTFLALRTLANRYLGILTCIAVSHSSAAATNKWLDLMGGAWNVRIVIDEERAVYAAWGLGLGSAWSVLNPATQVASWKAEGWLGQRVAAAVERGGELERRNQENQTRRGAAGKKAPMPEVGRTGAEKAGPTSAMGNKWQESGAWAVDQRGTIVWGGKANSADHIMDLDAAIRALGF